LNFGPSFYLCMAGALGRDGYHGWLRAEHRLMAGKETVESTKSRCFILHSTTETRTLNALSKQEAFCPKSVTRENHLVTSHHFRPQTRRVSEPISTSTSPPSNHPLHNHLLPPHNFHENHNHAMTSAPQNLTIYPDYCHALSPTIGKWVPLRATDIHGLQKVGMFCDRELPIALLIFDYEVLLEQMLIAHLGNRKAIIPLPKPSDKMGARYRRHCRRR